ncbi:MAG: VWA domain-containing protein [Luteibaculaceae bacterium]
MSLGKKQSEEAQHRFQNLTERYLNFGTVPEKATRKYLVQWFRQKVNPLTPLPEENKESYQLYINKVLDPIFNIENLRKIGETNETLNLQIITDIFVWFTKTIQKNTLKHPYQEEQQELESWGVRGSEQLSKSWEYLPQKISMFNPGDAINIDFFVDSFKKLLQGRTFNRLNTEEAEKFELLTANLLAKWDATLQGKILAFRLSKLEIEAEEFMEGLTKKLAQFSKINQLLDNFSDYLNKHWDANRGLYNDADFNMLDKFNSLFEQEEEIKKIADLLGKLREAEIESQEESFETTFVRQNSRENPLLRSEIVGITHTKNLSDTLPTEITLLSDEKTEDLFLAKYVSEKLMGFQFEDKEYYNDPKTLFETQQKTKLKEKGPFIICVDTSGSMEGEPERIAKAICFGILKLAQKENRDAFLINFSTGIKTINLSDIGNQVDSLANFLKLSFRGGTDITLALAECLKKLNENQYKEADVLVVSDFVMYKIEADIEQQIKQHQNNKDSHFHALILSDNPADAALSIFDNFWVYNPYDKKIMRQLYKNLEETF